MREKGRSVIAPVVPMPEPKLALAIDELTEAKADFDMDTAKFKDRRAQSSKFNIDNFAF